MSECDISNREWSYLCCDAFPESWQADDKECPDCHDPEYQLEPDQFWVLHGMLEIGDSCQHCGVSIVDAADEEMRLDDEAREAR